MMTHTYINMVCHHDKGGAQAYECLGQKIINLSRTSKLERPHKPNKILCHQLSTFALTMSR